MTCVVGIVQDGKVILGADSAGVGDWSMTVRADEKVFKNGPFVMGFTTSFRMGQLLRFKLSVPEQLPDQTDYAFMVTTFIEAVRDCLKKGGYAKVNNNVEEGGRFLVGYRGNLYMIDDDFQVGMFYDGFHAVGCGDQIARGALYATQGYSTGRARVFLALEAAERCSAGVRSPFVIIEEGQDS